MSCYLRHLEDVLRRAGIEPTAETRREVDQRIHELVRVEYKNCPAAWREVKRRLVEDEQAFVRLLRLRRRPKRGRRP